MFLTNRNDRFLYILIYINWWGLKLEKCIPFHAEPPPIEVIIGSIDCPPPPAPLFLGFGHVISAVRLKKVPNKNARLIEPRIQSSSSILPTWWGNRHIAPNRGTAGLLGRNWICLLFPIGFRRFSRHRGINLFVNNTDYIKSKLIIDNYQRKDRLIIYDRLLEKRLYHNSTRK